jgi:hypothetical protein
MTMTPNLRALRVEAAFMPASVEAAAQLRQQLVDAGHSSALADGIVGWLIGKAAGHVDRSSSATRSSYRRILSALPLESGDATRV